MRFSTKLLKFNIISLVIFITILFVRNFQEVEVPYKNMYFKVPSNFQNSSSNTENGIAVTKRPFTILFWTQTWHGVHPVKFFESLHGCDNEFEVTAERSYYNQADAVVFAYYELNAGMREGTLKMPPNRNPDVPWILVTQESPIRTKPLQSNIYDGAFNFTWGYRNNADIRTSFEEMYEKYKSPDDKWIYGSEFSFEFVRNKTKLAAWVVSNCRSEPSNRDLFVKELAKHGVSVDIYGNCGQPCHGSGEGGNWRDSNCFSKLGIKYKFYMTLENSLCLDYVTEKSEHGWAHNMVPIIYALGNKELVAPPDSYIDALEFNRIEDLAEYIKFLDGNPKEYFKYFKWRSMYNISSSFHSRAHCYAWKKIKNLTEELRSADYKARNVHFKRNLELWRSYFYNGELNMYCRNILTSSQVNITHPKQNKMTLYNVENCLGNNSLQNLQVDSESWY